MACPAQSMLSASGCIFLGRSKPQATTLVRGSVTGVGGRQLLLTCSASSSPSPSSPAPPQEDSDCNEEECAPEKEQSPASGGKRNSFAYGLKNLHSVAGSPTRLLRHDLGHQTACSQSPSQRDKMGDGLIGIGVQVGSLSAEWLTGERTQVMGTFPPKKKAFTGYVEKDTAGQTNVYSVEPTVYVAESAISSGAPGAAADGAENTAAIAGGLVLITVAAASSILIQVSKNQPRVPATDYSGPPLSYYVAKFQPQPVAAPALEAPAPAAPVEVQDSPAVEAAAPEATSTVEASAAPPSPEAEQLSS